MSEKPSRNQRAALSQVQCPLLPQAEEILPYLVRVDGNRWYSNRGELARTLERRLSERFGQPSICLVTLSSGSAAIEAAILAAAGRATPERPLALTPSYTFVATALSAIRCGYRPYFVDVDPVTWAMDPAACLSHPALAEAGLILPVAPFGRAPDMAAWEAVRRESGVPVVVDAAASFEQYLADPALVSASVPAALSFHATKSFSTVEGGGVVWRDEPGLFRVGQTSYFGVTEARLALREGFNGKLSEYHAAIGHACLDGWAEREAACARIAAAYDAAAPQIAGRIVTAPTVSAAYVLHEAQSPAASEALEQRLAAHGIGTRRWYGPGLHAQPFFAAAPRDPMPVTEDLAARHLGLPAAVDLTQWEVAAVIEAIAAERGGSGTPVSAARQAP